MALDPLPSPPVSRLSRKSPRWQERTESDVSSPSGSAKDPKSRPRSLDLNEDSPLLSPQRPQTDRGSEDNGGSPGTLDWNDGEEEESKSTFYLLILTLGIGG